MNVSWTQRPTSQYKENCYPWTVYGKNLIANQENWWIGRMYEHGGPHDQFWVLLVAL